MFDWPKLSAWKFRKPSTSDLPGASPSGAIATQASDEPWVCRFGVPTLLRRRNRQPFAAFPNTHPEPWWRCRARWHGSARGDTSPRRFWRGPFPPWISKTLNGTPNSSGGSGFRSPQPRPVGTQYRESAAVWVSGWRPESFESVEEDPSRGAGMQVRDAEQQHPRTGCWVSSASQHAIARIMFDAPNIEVTGFLPAPIGAASGIGSRRIRPGWSRGR